MAVPTVSTGISQAFAWQTSATHLTLASTVYSGLCPGLVVGGEIGPTYQTKVFKGIGGQRSKRALMQKNTCSLKVQATTDTKALMQAGVRGSAGGLTYLDWAGGGYQQWWLYLGGKIGKMDWSVAEVDAPLEVAFELSALTASQVGGYAPSSTFGDSVAETALSSEILYGEELVVTIGGTDYACHKMSGSVDYSLKFGRVFTAKSSGTVRQPDYDVELFEKHELSFETYMPITSMLSSGVPYDSPPVNIAAVAAFTNISSLMTLTYGGSFAFMDGSGKQGYTPEGETVFKYKLSDEGAGFTLLTIT